jgi:hypothetical protein
MMLVHTIHAVRSHMIQYFGYYHAIFFFVADIIS